MHKIKMPNGRLLDIPDDLPSDRIKKYIYDNYPDAVLELQGKSNNESNENISAQQYFNQNRGKGIQNIGSVGRDVYEGVKGSPGAFKDIVKSLPMESVGAHAQLIGDPDRAVSEFLAGAGNTGVGVLNLPKRWANYQEEKGLIPRGAGDWVPHVPNVDFNELLGLEGEQPGDKLISGVGGFAPLAKFGGGLGQNSRLSALYSAANEGDPVEGALMPSMFKGAGKALNVGGKIAGSAIDTRLHPMNILAQIYGGELTPDELRSNVRAAGGTNIPFSEIVESPELKEFYENHLPLVPFSGQKGTLNKIKSQVENSAEDFMENLRPKQFENQSELFKAIPNLENKIHEEPGEALKEVGVYLKKQAALKKAELFNPVDEIARQTGFELDLSEFNDLAKKSAKAMENSPLLLSDPEFNSVYKDLVKKIDSSSGNKSIAVARGIADKLIEEGEKMKAKPNSLDEHTGRLYVNLGESLRRDIYKSIKEKGSKELQQADKVAMKNYKENFVPFLDRDIFKLFNDKKSAETFARDIIKPGKKNDKYKAIEKFQKVIPPELKDLLGYFYLEGFRNTEGVMTPQEFNKAVKSLGSRQFKALFSDELGEKVQDQARLAKMGSEGLNVMHNPKTANRLLKTLSGVGHVGVGYGLGPLGSAAALPLEIAGARYLNDLMTNPKHRANFVERIIEQKNRKAARTGREQ